MTLDQKIGQMLFDTGEAAFININSDYFQRMKWRIENLHLGGYILYRGTPHDTAALINELQRSAKIPLLITGDLERGAASQFPLMAVSVPSNLAVAATGDVENAAFVGALTAREGRAVGFHWTYAPVADVNNNPDNPIINVRSYGEDPGLVSRMVEAYVRAGETAGILTTAKHFPGHGDTAVDSHIDLGVVAGDRARLDKIELAPFRAAIRAGTSSIMTAHLAVPSIEADPRLPATMSRAVLTGLLREQLGFQGLIVTDAMNMGGITTQYWAGDATIRAVEAGADCVLMPPYPELSFRVLRTAVRSGRISEERINQSVERILRAKARLGLHENRLVDLNKIGAVFGDPSYQKRAEEIAARSITVVRDDRKVLPISQTKKTKLLVLILNADQSTLTGEYLSNLIKLRIEDAQSIRIGPDSTDQQLAAALQAAQEADVVVAPVYVRISAWRGSVAIPSAHRDLLRRISALNKPLMAVSMSNPYLLRDMPEIPGYMCAYSAIDIYGRAADVSERAVARALFGENPIRGRLPVTIPSLQASAAPLAAIGSGLQLPMLPMKLESATAGQDQRFQKAFGIIEDAIKGKGFPGGVVAVGHKNQMVALKAFGTMDYSPGSPRVPVNAIWDMASLSKVIGTTSAVALLVQEKMVPLDSPIVRYIPEFLPNESNRDQITVKRLLAHTGGLKSFDPRLQDAGKKPEILARAFTIPLDYYPGAKTIYSDIGFMTLAEMTERVSGQPMDQLLRQNVFDALGMRNTMYNPGKDLLSRIPPTEDDKTYRKRVVRGEVHDERAWAMGGVAGHAGLFSSAEDLAIFAQMMLNGGIYTHKRIFKRSTVELFTRKYDEPPNTTRAMGWDTPSPSGRSSAGRLLSPNAFGHTGFTGTSIWIDPDKELFIILLTNRVHPTRDNPIMDRVRPAVADAVVEALEIK